MSVGWGHRLKTGSWKFPVEVNTMNNVVFLEGIPCLWGELQALEKELIAERDAKVAAEAKVLDLSRQLKKLNYQQEQQQFRKSTPDQPATPPAKSSSGAPRSRSVSPKASPDGSPKRLTPTLTGNS